MDYELNLQGTPRGATISNLGIEHHSPTFGFWFKAGVAFTLGAVCTYAAAWLLWIMLLANVALGLARAFTH